MKVLSYCNFGNDTVSGGSRFFRKGVVDKVCDEEIMTNDDKS